MEGYFCYIELEQRIISELVEFCEQFPKLNYDFPFEDIYGVEMLDVFRRVAFKFDDYSKNTRSTFDYIPEAGDTADIIAGRAQAAGLLSGWLAEIKAKVGK